MKIQNRRSIPFFLCMAVIFFFMLYQCSQKKGTFVDELLTYDLSNRQSSRVEFITSWLTSTPPSDILNDVNDLLRNGKESSRLYRAFKELEQQEAASVWHDGSYYAGFITAEQGHRFDFLSVMYNAVYDSAPPFYYYFIHLICSLFPGSFSLWYGLIVNIIFLMLTCALLYRLSEKYFGGAGYAFLVTLCYALSIGGISTLLIIRMYAVHTFFTLAFLGVCLHIAQNGFSFTKKSRAAYILCAVLGFYTQYYFVIYAGFLVGTILVFLFTRKEYRPRVKSWLAASAAAAVVSLIVWPFSIKHIFMDSFGASTLTGAASGNPFHKFAAYYKIIADSLFAGQPLLFAVLCLLLIVLFFMAFLRKKAPHVKLSRGESENTATQPSFSALKPFLLFIPILGYLLLVALSAPFLADRYIMCIFPVLLLGMYFLYDKALSAVTRHAFPILCAAGVLITAWGLLTVPRDYTYPEKEERYAFMEQAENASCLYISEHNGWMYKSCLDIMSLCKNTAVLYPEQLSSEAGLLLPSDCGDKILVCIANSFDQEDILNTIITCCHLEDKKLTRFAPANDEYTMMYLFQ
ncbi:MAG: glycosyltransferase family 39 protein [Lachnospiraceae bacterium]|nr:glycosyltransferase family 39 protein [Lachnospiraceae bacterium]